jgi:hypothetical protein
MTTYAHGGPYCTSIASLPQGYCEEGSGEEGGGQEVDHATSRHPEASSGLQEGNHPHEEDPRPGTRRRQSQETQSKPVREAALLAMIKSLLAAKDDDPIIQKTLNDTMAAGKITISETGPVQYSL